MEDWIVFSIRLFWFKVFLTVRRAYRARESLFFRIEIWCLKFKAGSKYTPKNFIAGVESVELTRPSTLISSGRFWSVLLLLQYRAGSTPPAPLVNNINLVFSGCNTILLIRKYSHTLWSSSFTFKIRVLRLSWVSTSVVSSANSRDKNFEERGKSLMYNRNNSGPSIEPCGTPNEISSRELEWFFMLTNCFLFVR